MFSGLGFYPNFMNQFDSLSHCDSIRFDSIYPNINKTLKNRENYNVIWCIYLATYSFHLKFSSWLMSLWSLNIYIYIFLHINCEPLYWRFCTITWDRILISVSCSLSYYLPSEVYWCLFRAETGWSGVAASVELRRYSGLSLRKQRQNDIIVWIL